MGFADEALRAWEEGFSIVAGRLNSVLTEKRAGVLIDAAPAAGGSLDACAKRLIGMLLNVPNQSFVSPRAPEEALPWLVEGPRTFVLPVPTFDAGLDSVIKLLASLKNRTPAQWKEFVVDPVTHHAEQTRAALRGLIAAESAPGADNHKKNRSKVRDKRTVEERMKDALEKNPASKDWTAAQFAEHIGCTPPAVTGTKLWKKLAGVRATLAADREIETGRRSDRRRKPRKSLST